MQAVMSLEGDVCLPSGTSHHVVLQSGLMCTLKATVSINNATLKRDMHATASTVICSMADAFVDDTSAQQNLQSMDYALAGCL